MHEGDFTAYRLVIEGWGAEAVTDPAMEKTADDAVERIAGLLRDGIAIEESIDMARGTVESSGFTAQIVDRQYDEVWCEFCARQPTSRTWLTSDIDATTDPVTIDVDSSAGFIVGDYLHIGTECFRVTVVPDGTSLTAKRAMRGTILQAHYTEDGENLTRPVVTHTYPLSLEGRRAFLYEYRLDEHDLQGDGQLVWRGVASTDTSLGDDNATWSILIDSIYALLKQDIGGDTDAEFSLRGYYYSATHPLFISVIRHDGTSELAESFYFVTGHYETVDDLVDEVNSLMPAAVAGYTNAHTANSLLALAFEDGSWGFTFKTGGSETEYLRIKVLEAVASFLGGTVNLLVPDGYDEPPGTTAKSWIGTFTGDPMIAPRGVWGPHGGALYDTLDDDNNSHNVYPSGLTLLNVGDTLTVVADDGDDPLAYEVYAELDSSRRYRLTGPIRHRPFFTPETAPRFKKHTTYVSSGNLADFRDALVANGATDANRGAGPFITSSDVAAWSGTVSRSLRTAGPIGTRRYITAQAIKLEEMLSMECMLLGAFLRLDSTGKMGLGYLELPTGTSPVAVELTDENILISDTPPSWERNAINGTINTVELLTGYEPQEDEHTGPTFRVRDVTSLSIKKKTKQLRIEPKSMDTGIINARDVTNAFRRVLGVYGRPYSIVTLDVPITLRSSILCGSICSVTSPRIPNVLTGTRGVSGVKGVIIRQAWDFSTAHGQVTVMISDAQLLGYTPTVSVTSSSGAGTTRVLTVSSDDPDSVESMAPAALAVTEMFPVGTVVELMEWDAYSQSPQPGSVTAVTSTTITVLFDSTPTLTGTRYLRYGTADDVVLAGQENWAYMGISTSIVEFSNGDETAPEFSA